MNNAPIGIYDSGLGGLTVWREVRRLLPEESLLYLGDGKNCPYGSRPREEVRALADAAVARLVEEGCKLVVVACNTATAAAIDFLRANYAALPIVGMEPAVKPACQNTRSGVVGVLATERSLEGDLFHRTAARYGHDHRSCARRGAPHGPAARRPRPACGGGASSRIRLPDLRRRGLRRTVAPQGFRLRRCINGK